MYLNAAGHEDSPIFDDVIEKIVEQRQKGYKIALVTGQRKSVLNLLLEKWGCSRLFEHVFCEASPDKVAHFKAACERLKIDPK